MVQRGVLSDFRPLEITIIAAKAYEDDLTARVTLQLPFEQLPALADGRTKFTAIDEA